MMTRPRAAMLLFLSLAGAAGFLASFVALNSGLASMWLRYALAGLVAYLTFLALVGAWIARYRRSRRTRSHLDPGDGLDLLRSNTRGSGPDDFAVGGGGRSGGGGASGSWGPARGSSVADAVSGSMDPDAGWIVALAAGAMLAGVLAVGYIVYIAPVLFAELAVDAALVSTIYGRLRSSDRPRPAGLVRWTWLPAMALILTLAAAGWAMQSIAPEAKSIGGFVAALRD